MLKKSKNKKILRWLQNEQIDVFRVHSRLFGPKL